MLCRKLQLQVSVMFYAVVPNSYGLLRKKLVNHSIKKEQTNCGSSVS